MDFLPDEIQQYLNKHTSEPHELLKDLERETYAKILIPRMIAGHYQGRLLSMISKMIKPKQVLEVGTYTGYSALCFAEGLLDNGYVHTIDVNEELEPFVSKFISKSENKEKIKRYIGKASDIIPTLNEAWDIVFLDADKINYLNYYKLVFDAVKPGGYILADNVLWSGKVIDENEISNDADTKALNEFNKFIQEDNRVENVLLSVRDGIMIVRKL